MLHLYVEYLDNGVHRQIVVRADLRGDKRRISQFDYNWGLIEAYDPKVTLWQKIWKRFRIG